MSGASSSSSALVPRAKEQPVTKLDPKLAQQLVSVSHTKTSAVQMLQSLHDAGLLADSEDACFDAVAVKRQLTSASTTHSKVETMYGPLVQELKLDDPELATWEYMNPFAFLYYLSSVSPAFASMMRSICVDGKPLRIVLYADGLVPGNPFRPELNRRLMCIYWCIVDWPQHVLQRSFAWPVFGVLRTCVIDRIQGGLGKIMSLILRVFFSDVGASFKRGVHINCDGGGYVATAVFGGFLADLLGHKELTEWKGTGGIRCCISCDNVINMLHRKPKRGTNEVAANCYDYSKFVVATNETLFNRVDRLHDMATRGRCVKKLETQLGLNYRPQALLRDVGIRDIYMPVDHCIRDWQHTVCQDGIANTHIANLLHALKEKVNCPMDRVQDFSQMLNYPSFIGKLDKAALNVARLKESTISSFSSTILAIVPVLHMFMDMFFAKEMPAEFKAFTILHNIIGILRLGAEDAMKHKDTLRDLFANHLKAVTELYGDYVKPKAHHAMHIVDGMDWLGKLLSCFVTERKHRLIKRAALYIFRHMEHTILVDVVNTMFQQIIGGLDLYKPCFLIHPKAIALDGNHFLRSSAAVMRIGHVEHGDLVVTKCGAVAKIVCFWRRDSAEAAAAHQLFAEVDVYPSLNNDIRYAATTRSKRRFLDCHSFVDSLIWLEDSPGIIRISLPPALLFEGDP
jgi:hypothetical protein